MAEQSNPPVAIVGAGPAGLAVALLLAERGIASTLIGPPADPGDTRTTALLDGSIRALDGIWGTASRYAAPLRVISIVDATGRLLRAGPVSFNAAEIGLDAFGWNIANGDLIRAMEEAVLGTDLISRRKACVEQVHCREDCVSLALDNGDAIVALLAIAADGRASPTRAAAGIGVRQWSYPQVALTLNLRHARPHHDVSIEFHTQSGPFTLVPLPGNRSSLVCVVSADEGRALQALGDDALAIELERRSHSILGRMSVDGSRSLWPMGGLSAERLAAKRVALIGEATHVFPPIGAQGFNLTVRDGVALADIVAGQDDPGAPAVLEAYARQHRADVTSRTLAVDMLNRSLLTGFLPIQLGRGFALYALGRIGPLRRAAMRQGLGARLGP
jgi:2-octaprenyl-6-methoxyphenol hydroxylase